MSPVPLLARRRRYLLRAIKSGRVLSPYTFSRASDAVQVDSDSLIETVATDILRDAHYIDGERTVLMEGQRTNLVTTQDFSTWTKVNTPTVTGGQSDPAGGTDGYTVADDDTGSIESITHGVSFTGDAVKGVLFVVRENTMPASGVQFLQLLDNTAGAFRVNASISGWTNGEPSISVSTGTLLRKRELTGGWWLLEFQATSVTAANANVFRIIAASNASDTGSIDVYHVQAEDAPFPSSIIRTSGATATRAADALSFPFTVRPQEMTVYARFERGGVVNNNEYVYIFGDNSTPPYAALLQYSGGRFAFRHHNGSALVESSPAPVPSVGAVVEFRGVLYSDGSVQGFITVDGGTETGASQTAANALAGSYGASGLTIGTGSFKLFDAFTHVLSFRGILTRAQCRARAGVAA